MQIQLSNSFAESGKPKLLSHEEYMKIVKNVNTGVNTKLQSNGGMKNTFPTSQKAVDKAFNKNKITIGKNVSIENPGNAPKTPSKAVNVDTKQLPQGKKQLRLPANTYKP